MQKSSNTVNDNKKKISTIEDSLSKNKNNGDVKSSYGYDYWKNAEEHEHQSDIKSKEIELGSCVEFVSQLVDLFKHTVIIPELQSEHYWYDNHGHQIQRNKGTTGNILLDEKIHIIALEKGLTKEQWERLLYLNLTAGDSLEMINVSRSHLKKVHDMALRLLENEEQSTVFALIDAIEKYMPKNHYIDR